MVFMILLYSAIMALMWTIGTYIIMRIKDNKEYELKERKDVSRYIIVTLMEVSVIAFAIFLYIYKAVNGNADMTAIHALKKALEQPDTMNLLNGLWVLFKIGLIAFITSMILTLALKGAKTYLKSDSIVLEVITLALQLVTRIYSLIEIGVLCLILHLTAGLVWAGALF